MTDLSLICIDLPNKKMAIRLKGRNICRQKAAAAQNIKLSFCEELDLLPERPDAKCHSYRISGL